MKKVIISLIVGVSMSMFLFALEKNMPLDTPTTLSTSSNPHAVVIEQDSQTIQSSTREEIELYHEDFEGDLSGWVYSSGWELTESDYHSETHSFLSPNTDATQNGAWDLLSPQIELPVMGDGEIMHFKFWLKTDTPDVDGNGDDYLDDYYSVSIMDVDALAWHETDFGSSDGSNYWCGDEELEGYMDSWIQFLDMPAVTIPESGYTLTANMKWGIEDPAGAVVSGSCTDGWDAANVQISTDGGENWELLNGSDPYDFDCGYGWIWNSPEYDTGGSLNHLASGWGGQQGWHDVSFNLDAYAGQEVIVRFAFGSDPAYSTIDDATLTGLFVDDVRIEGATSLLDCSANAECETNTTGAVWVDQFYDYGDETQPGYQTWTEYLPGYPFNGNVFLDISDFAGKTVTFRFQSRYDEDHDGGQGVGIFIDDFTIYKESSGSFPAPWDLVGEGLDNEVALSWYDMNASGSGEMAYDNDSFNPDDGIILSGDGSAFAGNVISIAGPSTVYSVSVNNINAAGAITTIAGFGTIGALYNSEPMYEMEVTMDAEGWNTFDVSDWAFNNSFIIAYTFSADVSAALDVTAEGDQSMVMLGGGWDSWNETAAEAGLPAGVWGVRADVVWDGAGVTYNVYRDGDAIASGLSDSNYSDFDVENNLPYEYAVSATYSEGDESEVSASITVIPQPQTVHELSHDDGSAEEGFNAGSGDFSAVKYTANGSEDLVRFKWYQTEDAGAFYLKIFADADGMPGDEIYSTVVAGGLVMGWNEKDLSTTGLSVEGDFWIGTKEFSSTSPYGLDTSSDAGVSYTRQGSNGNWTPIAGNLMLRIFLDMGEMPECNLGDVNADGVINVLDIVSVVSFIMVTDTPTDSEACASDMNGDGVINVLDIVAIVGVIMGG
jgi:hypothetical protein